MIYKLFWIIRAFLYKMFFGKIGMVSYIGKPIYIHNPRQIFLGKKTRIFPNARMEVHGDGEIILENNVGIGQNFHITAGNRLIIGSGTVILANVFITDIDHEYQAIDIPILEQPNIVKETKIGENCFIGIGASIQAGTKLGKQCIVGTNSVVRGEFPDYCVIAGVPAKIIKKYNFENEKWEKVVR